MCRIANPRNPQKLSPLKILRYTISARTQKFESHTATHIVMHIGSRSISSLKISCSTSSKGCDWTGELGTVDDHMTTCEYELVECKNGCLDLAGATTKLIRKDSETHFEYECPKRIVQCDLCNEEYGESHIIEGEHAEKYGQVLVECWNDGCEEMVKRSELEDETHGDVCEYQYLDCKYLDHGCYMDIIRKEMPAHEEDWKVHLEMALETNTDLKKRLDTLEELHQSSTLKQATLFGAKKRLVTLEELHQSSTLKQVTLFGAMTKMDQNMQKIQDIVATFKIDEFQSHMEKWEFHSPPFYTSPGGYKMKVQFQAIQNFLSIKLNLEDTTYSQHLIWPFQAKIEIQILNRESNDNHLSTLIIFQGNKEDTYVRKGNKKAVAIEKLSKRYLLQDTVYFRVIVHKTLKPQPWLVCTV